MSDWRNSMPMIVNKIRYQFFSKKLGNLENVRCYMKEVDCDGSCNFSKEEFKKFLAKIGIFLTTQELTIVFNLFDINGDGNISFAEFFESIRNSMSDGRIALVKKVFKLLDPGMTGHITLSHCLSSFSGKNHPSVRIKEKSVEIVEDEFKDAIINKSRDGATITEFDFLDYYADVSACLPNEREDHFIDILSRCWGLIPEEKYVSPERVLDIEMRVFEKVRQKTVGTDNEGVTLRRKFSHVDRFGLGIIDFSQFKTAMIEMGCCFQDHELLALFNKYTNGAHKLVYSEVCDYFKDLGVGAQPNLNPTFSLYRSVPNDILDYVKKELFNNGYFGAARFRLLFQQADKNKNNYISRDEFQWCFKEIAINLTSHDFNKLFRYFDKNFDNQIDYHEFISSFIPPISQRRIAIIIDIFEKLCCGKETISYIEIGQHFNPANDPEIKAGYTTKNQLLSDLISLVPNKSIITRNDWIGAFTDIAALFDGDQEFANYMNGLWEF